MKKVVHITILLIILLAWNTTIHGMEEINTRYLGVGATIEEVEQATFMVHTEGKKQGEGFVYTPDKLKLNETVTFEVSLEGKNKTVFLKIIESDGKGKFIAEHTTPMILLTPEWKKYKLTAQTNKKTKQVDVFVLAEGNPTQFQFRDVIVK